MYLLIPGITLFYNRFIKHLHPTMYLLIPETFFKNRGQKDNLHPTMYLLILELNLSVQGSRIFTSHYVSINSFANSFRCCKNR